jgi:hypothetical protein
MALGQARVKSTDPRARRNAARLANRDEQIASGVLGVDDQGRIVLNLSADPGLENSDGLRVKVASPIERTASGIGLNLAADPGLEDVSGLRVDAVGPLARTSEGLELSLPDPSVLQVVGGDLTLAYSEDFGLGTVSETLVVQSTALKAWWKFDDGAGTTAEEQQFDNDGTLEGSFTGGDGSGWSSDHPAVSPFVSGSLDTAGADNGVELGGAPVPDEFDIDPDGDDYSVCFFMKTTTDGGYIVAWAGYSSGFVRGGFVVETIGDELRAIIGGSGMTSDAAAEGLDPNDGSWHHVAVTVQNSGGTAVKIYLDAVEVGSSSNAATSEPSDSYSWTAGARLNSTATTFYDEWTGKICDLRIYHTVLTAAEVAAIADGTEVPGPLSLAVDIASTDPGLEFDGSGDLQVKVASPIERTASGIGLNLAADPGLEDVSGLRVKIKADSGLTVDGDGLQVTPAAAQTDSSQDTLDLSSVTDPADAPADADALRDDLVANALAELQTRDGELETAVETLAGEFNSLLAKLRAADLLTS